MIKGTVNWASSVVAMSVKLRADLHSASARFKTRCSNAPRRRKSRRLPPDVTMFQSIIPTPYEAHQRPEVNAIYVATPPSSHAMYMEEALKAGKPVYVEKPITTSADSCSKMIDTKNKLNGFVSVAHYRRELALFRKVKELISSGEIGRVTLMKLSTLQPKAQQDHHANQRQLARAARHQRRRTLPRSLATPAGYCLLAFWKAEKRSRQFGESTEYLQRSRYRYHRSRVR